MEFARLAMGGYDIPPSEFWAMTPQDFWLIHDGRIMKHKATERKAKLKPMTPYEFEELKCQVRAAGHKV